MKIRQMILIPVLASVSVTAFAQKWEIGAVGGGSFYTKTDVTLGSNSVEAKFAPSFAVGFVLGNEIGRYLGGDIRYTFMRNDAQLSGNSSTVNFGAQSHTIQYDFLLHFAPPGQKTRPYISFGAGVRHYQGTGNEVLSQPLSNYAILTKTTDTTPMASVGFGVKFRVSPKSNIRIEFKDYITPAPSKVIAPNRGASLSGWFHNFVPLLGVSYVF
ncbi:MAG: outer membrane beta-barrel protein [Acidobacteria bacterium]|nr:outer membrane beta-barrel protein [Acidobacteriota bacterium]